MAAVKFQPIGLPAGEMAALCASEQPSFSTRHRGSGLSWPALSSLGPMPSIRSLRLSAALAPAPRPTAQPLFLKTPTKLVSTVAFLLWSFQHRLENDEYLLAP